jgi:hypothetical protein
MQYIKQFQLVQFLCQFLALFVGHDSFSFNGFFAVNRSIGVVAFPEPDIRPGYSHFVATRELAEVALFCELEYHRTGRGLADVPVAPYLELFSRAGEVGNMERQGIIAGFAFVEIAVTHRISPPFSP